MTLADVIASVNRNVYNKNMDKPIAHAIFPTLIYTNQLGDSPALNHMLEQELKYYLFDADQGIQGEYLGLADMHLNYNLESFYTRVTDNAKIYAETLGVDTELFDFYTVKSTVSKLSRPDQHFVSHKHFSSDISFIYYLRVPENSDSLFFQDNNRSNELFGALFDRDRDRSLLQEDNAFNRTRHWIEPMEGMLVLFPSKTSHGTANTTGIACQGDRIAIVGDINLVLKQGQKDWEMGKVSLDQWRRF